MEQQELFSAIKSMLDGMETRLEGKISTSEQRMIQNMDEKISSSEQRMIQNMDEKISSSEQRMIQNMDEKISSSEQRMIQNMDEKIFSSEQRIKEYISSNNVEIGTILTEALEGVTDDIKSIKTDVLLLRMNDAQQTIDIVQLLKAR